MARKKKNTTENKKPSNPTTWLTKYEKLMYWSEHKVTDAVLDQLAEDLVEWVNKPGAFKVSEFTVQNGIIYQTFLSWAQKHERLGNAHKYAKEVIGNYRERLSTFKEHNCNPQTLNFVMGHYCSTWKKEQEVESDRRVKEKDKSSGDVHVHMDSFPDSDVVPEKEK